MMRTGAIEDIRDRLDLVEVVREYVPRIRKAGRGWKACCPFHQERTPSFTLSQEKQLWYCFGACHDGGDLFKFVMKAENLSFSEAAQRLAERAGVEWRPKPEELGPRERERLQVKDALEFAKDFYHKLLKESPEAGEARKYLRGRGVTKESFEAFELGYALPGGNSFLDAALRKGIQPTVLRKAGLVSEREAGRFRDYFRRRVLFPIRDQRGSVVGFGGRALGDIQPKYLNTPETSVFLKGRTLYGLYQGGPTVRKEGKAMVVEGYMDVLACHQAGLTGAVAPLGTALTPDHAALLKRYCREALLVFDPDAAGASAAQRGAELLLEAGFFVRIVTVPEGKDPDEFLLEHGAGALRKALEDGKDVAEFKTDQIFKSGVPRTPQEKARVVELLKPTFEKQPNSVVRSEWVRRLSGRLGIPEESLRAELRRKGRRQARVRASRSEPAKEPAEWTGVEVEEELLRLLFANPEQLANAAGLKPGDFMSERCRRVWGLVLGRGAEADWPKRIAAELPDELAPWLSRLTLEKRDFGEPEQTLKKLLSDHKRFGKDERKYKELKAAVVEMLEGRASMQEAVVAEYREFEKRLHGSRKAE